MKAKNKLLFFTTSDNASTPDWYWERGLHDAVITRKEDVVVAKIVDGVYYSNYIVFYIDASTALFESSVNKIIFYNCKELSDPNDNNIDGWIWKTDKLSFDGNKYTLEIEVQNGMSKKVYDIRFSKCDVQK